MKKFSLFFCVLCVSLSLPLQAQRSTLGFDDPIDQLPDLGSSAANYLSERDAKQLGKAFIRQTRASMDYISDPELIGYLNDIGARLIGQREHGYQFYLINSQVINAFAVPGGHIAMNSGILTKSKTESEFASVLAHEISHLKQRHIERRLESSRYDSFFALGALLAAAAAGSSDGAQAAFSLANASVISRQLSYSRNYESEADALGIRMLSGAGYSPQGMTDFFRRLYNESRISESAAPEFLRTHPLTINRITESAERALAYPDNSQANSDENQLRFRMMQMKALASYHTDPSILQEQLASKIANGEKDLATRYGYAIALTRNNKTDQARKELQTLLREYPNNISLKLAHADNELEARNINQGLDLLRGIYEEQRAQGNSMVDLYYGNALVLSRNSELAIPVLRQGILDSPEEPLFHILLARAYGETKQMYQSFLSRAQYHVMQGNYRFAMKQLKQAQKHADSNYEKARLNALKKEVAILIKELESITG
jgi:predicted Zn-dependent protease